MLLWEHFRPILKAELGRTSVILAPALFDSFLNLIWHDPIIYWFLPGPPVGVLITHFAVDLLGSPFVHPQRKIGRTAAWFCLVFLSCSRHPCCCLILDCIVVSNTVLVVLLETMLSISYTRTDQEVQTYQKWLLLADILKLLITPLLCPFGSAMDVFYNYDNSGYWSLMNRFQALYPNCC